MLSNLYVYIIAPSKKFEILTLILKEDKTYL